MLDLDTAVNLMQCLFLGGFHIACVFIHYDGSWRKRYRRLKTERTLEEAAKDNSSSTETSDSDDEALTCNVCERAFSTSRQLSRHQQKRRHYGCSICENIFNNVMALEQHKEEMDHWSDDDDDECCDNEDCRVGEEDEDEEMQETRCGEEMERLL